jgi:glycosyltransferase involved in cell wall biosynthesis
LSELLSIVVPVFNEEATVGAVIARLLAVDLPLAREILVINDGSTDGTRGVLDALPLVGETLRVVHAPTNGGKGRAIRTANRRAEPLSPSRMPISNSIRQS